MTPLLNTLLFSPLFPLILSIQDLTEACRCAPADPQQQICNSDIVIRATIWSKEEIIDSVSSLKIIQYEIKQVKMFKGLEKAKDVQYVFTPLTSRYCGVKLKVDNKKNNRYLLSGKILPDGRVVIYFCDFIKPWNDLTQSQKKNLKKINKTGCNFKPCSIATPNECLWMDWLKEQTVYGHQANNCAFFKGRDGTCSWHYNLP